jgi:hypothetical protein
MNKICEGEAKEIAEAVIEELYSMGIITDQKHGKMTMGDTNRITEVIMEVYNE